MSTPAYSISVARLEPGLWAWVAYSDTEGWYSNIIDSGRAMTRWLALRAATRAAGVLEVVVLDESHAMSIDACVHCSDDYEPEEDSQ